MDQLTATLSVGADPYVCPGGKATDMGLGLQSHKWSNAPYHKTNTLSRFVGLKSNPQSEAKQKELGLQPHKWSSAPYHKTNTLSRLVGLKSNPQKGAT